MTSQTVQTARHMIEQVIPDYMAGDDAPRVAIADDGKIIFANQSFKNLAHTRKTKALSVFSFEEGQQPQDIQDITAGIHTVRVNGNTDTEQFQFDWLNAPDQKRFLIASRVEQQGENPKEIALKAELEDLKTQLRQAESIGRFGRWQWVVGQKEMEWSNALYDIFGVTKEEFSPTLSGLSDMVHKQDQDRVMQALQRSVIAGNDYDMEFCIMQSDGAVRYLRCEGRCQRGPDGDVEALFGIMQDMTERVLYERDLKKAKESAERAYAAKTQFLANMSHELRTPLNAIIGFSEMMNQQLLGPLGSEKYLDYIKSILDSGEHLLDLINDILDMSKIEAGKHELDYEQVMVEKTLRLVLHMMEARANDGGVKIDCSSINCKGLKIVADRRAFMQIFLNVISNAVKFTRAEGSVKIEVEERDDFVWLRVIDTGIGIPANKLHAITQPFEQVSSHYTRDHEGTGLGLAITKELIELHGGTLMVDSTEGVGTTVSVRMPRDASKAKKQKKAA